MKRRWILFVPVALVGLLFGLFLYRMAVPEDRAVASRWVGKPVPAFTLPPATPGVPGLDSAMLADGKPRLVNIFASWCVPCRAEAPQLEALKRAGVPVVGIAIRDRPEDVARFLNDVGNPFDAIGSDMTSSVQIALGSSGVPETFVVDGKGVIRRQIQGVITDAMVPDLIAEVERLR